MFEKDKKDSTERFTSGQLADTNIKPPCIKYDTFYNLSTSNFAFQQGQDD